MHWILIQKQKNYCADFVAENHITLYIQNRLGEIRYDKRGWLRLPLCLSTSLSELLLLGQKINDGQSRPGYTKK
jgi:hypothetical protein